MIADIFIAVSVALAIVVSSVCLVFAWHLATTPPEVRKLTENALALIDAFNTARENMTPEQELMFECLCEDGIIARKTKMQDAGGLVVTARLGREPTAEDARRYSVRRPAW